MPRPKRPGAPEPKKRSRNGCWPCKARKVKCDEQHPICVNCQRTGETCDYSIRLNWEGRRRRKSGFESIVFHSTPSSAPTRSSQSLGDASTISTASSPLPSAREFPESVLDPAILGQSHGGGSQDLPPQANTFMFPAGQPISEYPGGDQDPPLFSPTSAAPVPTLPSPYFEDVVEPALRQTTTKSEVNFGSLQWMPAHKRVRCTVEAGSEGPRQSRISSPASTCDSAAATPRFYSGTSHVSADSPLTPAASSTYSDDDPRNGSRAGQQSPEVRRLSVNSLLSGPPGQNAPQEVNLPGPAKSTLRLDTRLSQIENSVFYGIDRGFKDLDMGKNDDMNAITGSSPKLSRNPRDVLFSGSGGDDVHSEFGFGVETNDLDYGTGGYYDKPVVVRIPRIMEPLPAKLRENPMNLMYFHHFLNHTARVLVPHDDPESNPFRTILPQMALTNDNLLSLLLAYSASHRARLLQQPEPAMRIALWVQDIFPALREALNDPTRLISKANIATAIMLASLEIISPTAFGYAIPWQKHLSLARELITSRPGVLRWGRTGSREDLVCSFLWSWLAYLDVLGTLSGAATESSPVWVLDYEPDDHPGEQDEIDCIMGFTTRCVYILARIAELARECDARRIGPDHRIIPGWQPDAATAAKAWGLEAEVKASLVAPIQPCKHIHNGGGVARWDRMEMAATNQAFHWAALVHLHRRVLGKPSGHEDVQAAVLRIHACLERVRSGSTAEACLLFPMFTAGCDTAGEAGRAVILERVATVEANGMMQVHKARRLMQRVWETGQPWETLLSTEFIG